MTNTSHTLSCDPTAPQQARAWAQTQLASAAQAIRPELADDALLCISELVTNALQARCEFATIDLVIDAGRLRIVVSDNGHGMPTPRNPGPSDPNGRGLLIIAAIAERWGVEPAGASKTVWAELAL